MRRFWYVPGLVQKHSVFRAVGPLRFVSTEKPIQEPLVSAGPTTLRVPRMVQLLVNGSWKNLPQYIQTDLRSAAVAAGFKSPFWVLEGPATERLKGGAKCTVLTYSKAESPPEEYRFYNTEQIENPSYPVARDYRGVFFSDVEVREALTVSGAQRGLSASVWVTAEDLKLVPETSVLPGQTGTIVKGVAYFNADELTWPTAFVGFNVSKKDSNESAPPPLKVTAAQRLTPGPYEKVGNVFIVESNSHLWNIGWESARELRMLNFEFKGQVTIHPDIPAVRNRLFHVRHLVTIDVMPLDELKDRLGSPQHISFSDLAAQYPDAWGECPTQLLSPGSPHNTSKKRFTQYRRDRLKDIMHRDAAELKLVRAKKQLMMATQDNK